jgi:alanine racemase
MLKNIQIAISHHSTPAVPVPLAYDMHGSGVEGVGIPNNRADIKVVLPVFDGDMKRVAIFCKIGLDSFDGKITVFILDIAMVTLCKQYRIVLRSDRPRLWVWPDSLLYLIHAFYCTRCYAKNMAFRTNIDSFLRKFEKDFATHNRIEISRSALIYNADLLKKITGKAVIPVLKGNAYGHGTAQVATALKNSSFPYIAVDGYFEALRIRKVSRQPVLIMGAIKPENFSKLTYDRFAFVVQDKAAIVALGKTGKKIAVHLECNTGMNRYGAAAADVQKLTKLILRYPNLTLEGVMSHLADSDGDDPQTVDAAVKLFDQCVETVRKSGASPTIIHIAQTAGSVCATSRYANTIRLGIGLYGINPFSPQHPDFSKLADLRPALRFISTVTKTIDLKKGESISYNYTFTAPKDMRIGVLPLGYYEGLPRALSNAGCVKYGKEFLPIVGRICMNHTMINLEGNEASHEGDEVVVYSSSPTDENSIDHIAQSFGLFSYNLLTALSPDVRRILTP